MTRRIVLSLVITTILSRQPAQAEPPEIGDFAPREGLAGQTIRLQGKGFTGTKRVLFTVGRTFKDARFKVVSDTELRVDAPEYYREAAEAAITVITPSGLTVTAPADALKVTEVLKNKSAGFYIVEPGGVLTANTGIVFVEPGGFVAGLTQGAVHYARSEGNVGLAAACVVYHERGTVLGEKLRQANVQLIEVPAVTRSTVPALFKYAKPVHAEPKAEDRRIPPAVRDIVPRQGTAGHIISLRGQGFWGTTSVVFKIRGEPNSAGFRIVSDSELRVEVPEPSDGRGDACPIVVVTDRGATLVTDGKHPAYNIVRKGVVHKGGTGGEVVFIEAGGVLAGSGAGGVTYLVKYGGILGAIQGGGCVIYHEPNVALDENAKRSKWVEVSVINLSLVKTPFRYGSK